MKISNYGIYILYNNYDKKSEEQLLNLIRNLISK